MTRIGLGAVTLLCGLSATAALADEPFGTEAWLASPQLCAEAKAAGSLQKTMDDGNLVLSAKGLRGADFQCHFVQVLKAGDLDAWVATALCRQEGAGDFPNVYSVSKGSDGRLTLVTVYDDEEPTANADGGDGAGEPDDGASSPDGSADAPLSQPAPAPGGTAAQGSGDAAQGEAPDAIAPEDVAVGDVYSRCAGVPAP